MEMEEGTTVAATAAAAEEISRHVQVTATFLRVLRGLI